MRWSSDSARSCVAPSKQAATAKEVEVRQKQLHELAGALCKIAKSCGLSEPDLTAKIIRNKIVRRVEGYRAHFSCEQLYDDLVDTREGERSYDWVCHLVRITNRKQTTRGKKANEGVSTVRTADQLTPVERRAVELLRGEARKSKKNLIEERAIDLAQIVEEEWFRKPTKRGRPKGKWQRPPRKDVSLMSAQGQSTFELYKPLLTITDVIDVVAPIIEGFARQKIAPQGDAFDALYHSVCAYSSEINRPTASRNLIISPQTVRRALNRSRGEPQT